MTATHADLLAARWRAQNQGLPLTHPLAQRLAAQEHGAFAREWAQESPFAAAVSLPLAIPGYAAGKWLNQRLGRPVEYLSGTPASLDQMAEAYRGLRQGLGHRIRGLLE